jgi:hypothetical protein
VLINKKDHFSNNNRSPGFIFSFAAFFCGLSCNGLFWMGASLSLPAGISNTALNEMPGRGDDRFGAGRSLQLPGFAGVVLSAFGDV